MFPHRYPVPKPRAVAVSTLVLAAFVLAFAAAMPATAQGNSGTIKVHDGPTADPHTRTEPHVSGDFFIEGFNMAEDGGDLLFYSWPPTGNQELVLATTWEADDGEPEFHFLAGPFQLPCGHYRVFAYNGDGPDDPSEPQPGGAKKKTFWVECDEEPEPGPEPTPTTSTSGTTTGTTTGTATTTTGPGPGPGPEPEMACPTDLEARANGDGSVTLTWVPAPGSDGTNIYRADGDQDFEYVTTVGPGVATYTDTTTTAGNAYAYLVTALFGNEESEDCDVHEVTAIPVFPTLAAFGLATLLGAGAYLALTARRKA